MPRKKNGYDAKTFISAGLIVENFEVMKTYCPVLGPNRAALLAARMMFLKKDSRSRENNRKVTLLYYINTLLGVTLKKQISNFVHYPFRSLSIYTP